MSVSVIRIAHIVIPRWPAEQTDLLLLTKSFTSGLCNHPRGVGGSPILLIGWHDPYLRLSWDIHWGSTFILRYIVEPEIRLALKVLKMKDELYRHCVCHINRCLSTSQMNVYVCTYNAQVSTMPNGNHIQSPHKAITGLYCAYPELSVDSPPKSERRALEHAQQ